MVVVCEPVAFILKTFSPPVHCNWYLVITPFGFTGGFQFIIISVELKLVKEKLAADASGT